MKKPRERSRGFFHAAAKRSTPSSSLTRTPKGRHSRSRGAAIHLASLLAARLLLGSPAVRGSLCWLPFALLVLVFFLSFLGLSYSIYPFVVIDRLTVWQAASSPESLKIILIGVCVTLPVIIAYTGFSYRVFRGKTIELDYA